MWSLRKWLLWEHPFHLPFSTLLFPPWSLSFPSEPVFNIDHEIFLPQAPDKSCIHRSLSIWSPRLNVFCRRLETCTTSSWWASGERRRWRCLTTTWRTCSTARTQRTQVPHACAWSRLESVRVRDSCSPESVTNFRQTAIVSVGMTARVSRGFVDWINTKVQRSLLTWGKECPHVHIWRSGRCLPLHLS